MVARGISRDAPDELRAGQASVMEVQGLLVIRIVRSSRNASLGCHPLARCNVSEHTALVICFDSTDDFSRGDHLHAPRQPVHNVHAQTIAPIPRVAISQGDGSVLPTTSAGATGQRAIGVNELVVGIGLPMSRFTTAANYYAGPVWRSSAPGLDCRGKMHQGSHRTKHALRVID